MKLLDAPEQPVVLQIGHSNLRAEVNHFVFTSKLVDGRFPDYRRVLPQHTSKTLQAGCEELRQAFSRAAILSNENSVVCGLIWLTTKCALLPITQSKKKRKSYWM